MSELNNLFRRWHCRRYRRELPSGRSAWAVAISPLTLADGEWKPIDVCAVGGEWLTAQGIGVDDGGVSLFDEFVVVAVTPFEAVNVAWEWHSSRDRDDDGLPEDWLMSPWFRAEWCACRWPKLPDHIGDATEMVSGSGGGS